MNVCNFLLCDPQICTESSYSPTLSHGFLLLKPTYVYLYFFFSLTCKMSRWNFFFTYTRYWTIVLHDPILCVSTLSKKFISSVILACLESSSFVIQALDQRSFSTPKCDLGESTLEKVLLCYLCELCLPPPILSFIIMIYNLFLISKVIDNWDYFSLHFIFRLHANYF
jgi:hypothetical protein